MEKERNAVAIIYGGMGYESEISILGYNNVLPHVDRKKYDVVATFIDKEGRWTVDGRRVIPDKGGFFCPEEGVKIKIDCAFPLLHGDYGEDGCVQGALECAGIPYVGCDVISSSVCRDKSFVKRLSDGLGIPTLPHTLLLKSEGIDFAIRRCEDEMKYPIFIKPARLGSSVGAGRADDRDRLRRLISNGFELCDRLMAEPCLKDKREIECAYYAGRREIITNPGEVLIKGTYGYEEKYTISTPTVTRAEIGASLAQDVREYSRRICRLTGIRDIARVDFFLTDEGLYLNEINTMPGMTESSLYPKMVEGAGIPMDEMLCGLIDRALCRR